MCSHWLDLFRKEDHRSALSSEYTSAAQSCLFAHFSYPHVVLYFLFSSLPKSCPGFFAEMAFETLPWFLFTSSTFVSFNFSGSMGNASIVWFQPHWTLFILLASIQSKSPRLQMLCGLLLFLFHCFPLKSCQLWKTVVFLLTNLVSIL